MHVDKYQEDKSAKTALFQTAKTHFLRSEDFTEKSHHPDPAKSTMWMIDSKSLLLG